MSKELEALKRLADNHRLSYFQNDFGIRKDYEVVEKAVKALEIIKNYGYFDEQGDLIVHLPTNRKEEYDLLKEVLL